MNIPSLRRALLVVALLCASAALTAGEFTKNLTPDNLLATGLGKLSKKELAELERLIELYKDGSLPESTGGAATATATPRAKDTREARVEKEDNKGLPDWVGALITLKRAENAPGKPQALESQLVGDFSGWTGKTNFTLENGQVWTQVNTDSYRYTPAIKTPRVKIYPATFGSFWMEIEGVGQKCRVRPLRLE